MAETVEMGETVTNEQNPDPITTDPVTTTTEESTKDGQVTAAPPVTEPAQPAEAAEATADPAATTDGATVAETVAAVAAEAPASAETPAPNPEPSAELTELQKYWKAVKENPTDFTGWTYLLQFVEQENDLQHIEEAFDAFLKRYPYCYGYWKKYADTEKKLGDLDRAERVFEQGLIGVPLSIDLWLHYIQFAQSKYDGMPDKEDIIRRLFERAVMAAGTDFRSDRLWEQYQAWEEENKDLRRVTKLYDRVLAIPTQCYSRHYERFYKHVKDNHPKDILSLDEFFKLRKEVLPKDGPEAIEVDAAEDGDAAPPGVDAPPPGIDTPPPGVEAEAAGTTAAPGDAAAKADDTEVPALREKVLELRRKVHKANEEEVSKRWYHEEGIRRPYFHVKPLEKSQLKSWREYLDFEIEQGSHERVLVLFERCLIACALYEEFWTKYAKYLETYTVDGVRNVLRRACTIHLPKKPSIYLAWAAFEERQGKHEEAVRILDSLEEQVPGLVMVALRKISLQRRQGNFDQTGAMYEEYIKKADTPATKSFYAIKHARYLSKILGDLEKATAVLEEALEGEKDNAKLYLQLIDLEYQRPTLNEPNLLRLFDKAITSPLTLEHRVAFSQRRLEFLEDFGSNISRLMDAYDEHQKLLKEMQSSRKRKADSTQEESAKKAKKEAPPATNGSTDHSAAAQQQHHQGHMDHNAMSNYNNYNQGWGGYNMPQHNPYGYHQGWGQYNQGYGQYNQGYGQ